MLTLVRTGYCVLTSGLIMVASCAQDFSGSLPCSGVATSFEFTDTDGEFMLAEDGLSVTFTGGVAQRVGNLSLYRTGLFAWMIPQGESGTIQFDPPVVDVSLYIKDQFDSNASELIVVDATGAVIATFDGTTSFANARVTSDPATESPIASISFQNNGTDGFSVIEDFQACVTE